MPPSGALYSDGKRAWSRFFVVVRSDDMALGEDDDVSDSANEDRESSAAAVGGDSGPATGAAAALHRFMTISCAVRTVAYASNGFSD